MSKLEFIATGKIRAKEETVVKELPKQNQQVFPSSCEDCSKFAHNQCNSGFLQSSEKCLNFHTQRWVAHHVLGNESYET